MSAKLTLRCCSFKPSLAGVFWCFRIWGQEWVVWVKIFRSRERIWAILFPFFRADCAAGLQSEFGNVQNLMGNGTNHFLNRKVANLQRKTKNLNTFVFRLWWERVDSNHRSQRQQIYSLPPLATRELSHINLGSPAKRMFCWGKDERHNERDLPLAAG